MSLLLSSPKHYFTEKVEFAFERLNFHPLPLSKNYLVDLLERYVISTNLFPVDEETGRAKKVTLAELYLRAQNSTPQERADLLKKLGDTSLYISGFFGDSLNRQVVDVEYYAQMGGVAYHSLSASAPDEDLAAVYNEYSLRFVEFMDVLAIISQDSLVKTNEDLLRLYDRYLATGSKVAQGQLVEKGLLHAQLNKSKIHKV